jgi:hypothetical protein
VITTEKKGEKTMGACGCGYTTDPEKNCNGTHKVVKAVKEDIIAKLEAEGFADAAAHLKA